jgi:SulP family sulfate permease
MFRDQFILGILVNTILHPAPAHPSHRRVWVTLLPFLRWRRQVTPATLRADFLAGLTGAIIVLPQGMAFALIAGLPPEYGLYTAIVTPIVAALFGSSKQLVSGPTTAISIVVLGVVSNFAPPGGPDYLSYVLTLTFMTGLFQLLLGVAGLGGLVNFISHTVEVGFTMGAAVLIATNQLKYFFGLPVKNGESFLNTLISLLGQLGNTNLYVLLVALVTLGMTLLVRRYRPRWPSLLIGIIGGSLVCLLVDGRQHGVLLLGSLPAHLPPLSGPDFSLATFRQLAPGALAVGMLGLIEAVSIARKLATRSHQRIDSNQEFIGQGLSNLLGSFFSCYAGSGSLTRSGLNYDAGAKTPLSAIFASLLVALVLLFLAPLTAYLPMSAMAGGIMLVAWNLIDIKSIRLIARTSRQETAVLVATFLATLFIALAFAIYAGVLLSLVLYLQRTSHPNIVSLAPNPDLSKRRLSGVVRHKLLECPQLKIIRLDGSLFFGAVDHVQNALQQLGAQDAEWKHILLIGSGINFIDVAGAEMLAQEARRLQRKGGGLYLCRLKKAVQDVLERGGHVKIIGRDHVFASKEEAIRTLFQKLDSDRCSLCTRRIFRECAAVQFEGRGVLMN